jgi:hypothetical protein
MLWRFHQTANPPDFSHADHCDLGTVLALAPNAARVKAARSLATPRPCPPSAVGNHSVWAPDPVTPGSRIARRWIGKGPTFQCSCPAQILCKHGLALLLMLAERPARFSTEVSTNVAVYEPCTDGAVLLRFLRSSLEAYRISNLLISKGPVKSWFEPTPGSHPFFSITWKIPCSSCVKVPI